MPLNNLEQLWIHELQDLWSAENQILEALPGVINAARDPELKKAYEDHSRQTESHIRRLEQILESVNGDPQGHTCKGMKGLLKEVDEVLNEDVDDEVVDAALVAATQRVEHYEIAGYGVARTFAQMLGKKDAAELLQKTLDEEGSADRKLTQLAERRLNAEAKTAHA